MEYAPEDAPLWVKPGTRDWQGLITCIVMFIAVAVFLSLRIYLQSQRSKTFSFENMLLVLAAILYYAQGGLSITAILTGCENVEGPRPLKAWILYTKIITAWNFLTGLPATLVKISFCFLFMRIFPQNKSLKIVAGCIITVSLISIIPLWCIPLLPCKAEGAVWSVRKTDTICAPKVQSNLFYAYASLSLITEVAVFCTPFPLVVGIQTTLRRKVSLFAIFSLGFISIMVDVGNLVLNAIGGWGRLPKNPGAAAYFRVSINMAFGLPILVACACTFKPLVDGIIGFWRRKMGLKSLTNTSEKENEYRMETIGSRRQTNRRGMMTDEIEGDFELLDDDSMDTGGLAKKELHTRVP